MCAAGPARADPAEELERLRAESARLHLEVDALDARIRALERGVGNGAVRADGPAAAAAPLRPDLSPLAQLRLSWSRVERGVPAERVESLLGKPDKLLRIDGSPVWYYVYPGVGRGSVFFDAGGKVSSTQSPDAGWSR
ncbi:MAG TPA: hypothetical protein VI319_12855 [Burkholderiales bacterium]